jgi:hypothetical protein
MDEFVKAEARSTGGHAGRIATAHIADDTMTIDLDVVVGRR